MSHNSTARRRWFGSVCLLAAIAMLVADEYFFKGRLAGMAFVVYWLVCLVFTLLAIGAAYLDVRALRRATRDEQRALFENTLQNISKERSSKPPDSD